MTSSYQRRFLYAAAPSDLEVGTRRVIRQAYWKLGDGWSIRLRNQISAAGDVTDSLTIKGRRRGAAVAVFGLGLDAATTASQRSDLEAFFEAAGEHVVHKNRSDWVAEGRRGWVDCFLDANAGLVIAEFEDTDEARLMSMRVPDGAEREVTSEPEYTNESLAYRPFRTWT